MSTPASHRWIRPVNRKRPQRRSAAQSVGAFSQSAALPLQAAVVLEATANTKQQSAPLTPSVLPGRAAVIPTGLEQHCYGRISATEPPQDHRAGALATRQNRQRPSLSQDDCIGLLAAVTGSDFGAHLLPTHGPRGRRRLHRSVLLDRRPGRRSQRIPLCARVAGKSCEAGEMLCSTESGAGTALLDHASGPEPGRCGGPTSAATIELR
jgi:hypothetical protein